MFEKDAYHQLEPQPEIFTPRFIPKPPRLREYYPDQSSIDLIQPLEKRDTEEEQRFIPPKPR